MGLDLCVDFSDILSDIPKMRKAELARTAVEYIKKLQDTLLEYEKLDKAYYELLIYKNELRDRLKINNQ